jgi:hypothetical protein
VFRIEFPQALEDSGDNAIAAGAHEGKRVLSAGANAFAFFPLAPTRY